MKKVVLFAFKSSGSIDLLISCALFNNLPFKTKSIDIVTDSFEILYKIINSQKEFKIIEEELNIKINFASYFIRNKFLINASYFIFKKIENLLFILNPYKLKIFLKILHRFFSYLHIKSINNNLKIFKKIYLNNSLIFIERNKWDQRHFFVSRNFIDRKIYIIPDAPLRELAGYSNSGEIQNFKKWYFYRKECQIQIIR